MAFATNIYKVADDYTATYNFNKSINQYFASGYIINGDSGAPFNCVYNNGTAFGWAYYWYNTNNIFNISCSANSITISTYGYNGNNLYLNAVLIYPAIYGDVTIS